MEQPPRYRPEYLQAFGLLEVEWNRIEGALFDIFYQSVSTANTKLIALSPR